MFIMTTILYKQMNNSVKKKDVWDKNYIRAKAKITVILRWWQSICVI